MKCPFVEAEEALNAFNASMQSRAMAWMVESDEMLDEAMKSMRTRTKTKDAMAWMVESDEMLDEAMKSLRAARTNTKERGLKDVSVELNKILKKEKNQALEVGQLMKEYLVLLQKDDELISAEISEIQF